MVKLIYRRSVVPDLRRDKMETRRFKNNRNIDKDIILNEYLVSMMDKRWKSVV